MGYHPHPRLPMLRPVALGKEAKVERPPPYSIFVPDMSGSTVRGRSMPLRARENQTVQSNCPIWFQGAWKGILAGQAGRTP